MVVPFRTGESSIICAAHGGGSTDEATGVVPAVVSMCLSASSTASCSSGAGPADASNGRDVTSSF